MKPLVEQHERLKSSFELDKHLSVHNVMQEFTGYGKQLLDLDKTQQQLEAQRERHKKAKKYRDNDWEQVDLVALLDSDEMPWTDGN